jgi:hypothetical protein
MPTWEQQEIHITETQKLHSRKLEQIEEKLDRNNETVNTKLDKITNELTALKVKSGAWGALGTLVTLAIGFIVYWIQKGLSH